MAAESGDMSRARPGGRGVRPAAPRPQWMRKDEKLSLQLVPTQAVPAVKVQGVPPKLASG